MTCRFFVWLLAGMILLGSMGSPGAALAAATFQDTRFQGLYTTENLNAILQEYELFHGWYWTTEANVPQNYHGHENKPGLTDTTANNLLKKEYEKGWYGCRWNWDTLLSTKPNGSGWGECYGFSQFIGYLLSGKRNPQGSKGWKFLKHWNGPKD